MGGTAPYQYTIGGGNLQSSPTFSGLLAGTYVARAIDANGCQASTTVVISDPQVLDAQLTISDISCNGQVDGEIDAMGTGGVSPYEYSLDGSNFQSPGIFDGLATGSYSLTIRDQNGCEETKSIEISEPDELELTVSQNGRNVELTATGGTSPYMYSIDGTNFQSSLSFNGLSPGSYIFLVRDANGCETQSESLEIVLGITDPTVSVFPNPTSEILEVKGGVFDRLEIYNLQGQKVLTSNNRKVSVVRKMKGVYILRLFAKDKEVHNQKLIIN